MPCTATNGWNATRKNWTRVEFNVIDFSRLALKKALGGIGGDQSSRSARRDAKEKRIQLLSVEPTPGSWQFFAAHFPIGSWPAAVRWFRGTEEIEVVVNDEYA